MLKLSSNIKYYATLVLLVSIGISYYYCNINRVESPKVKSLTLQKMTPIKVPEPSGLALSYDANYFWIVSDEESKIFKLNKSGKIVSSFIVSGEDLEGVTAIDSIKLAVIFERTREVLIIDTLGNEIARQKFNLNGKLNEGLEGVCYNGIEKTFYFVNEKNPGLLIKTDINFKVIFQNKLNLANDYSDIYYSKEDNTVWILSDESKKIIQTDLGGKKLNEYKIKVAQPEGLVVDIKNKKVFIVCDKKERLYQFALP